MQVVCPESEEAFASPELRPRQERPMSPSTAVIVNVVLDAVVLGALGCVCRVPLRLGVKQAELRIPSRRAERVREQVRDQQTS